MKRLDTSGEWMHQVPSGSAGWRNISVVTEKEKNRLEKSYRKAGMVAGKDFRFQVMS